MVSGVANLALYGLWQRSPRSLPVEFGSYPLVEVDGVLFTGFEMADLVLCMAFGFLDLEHVVHHSIHSAQSESLQLALWPLRRL